jgi:phospholipid/cholesterol/gamma-HCH transport system ATP-binding protein
MQLDNNSAAIQLKSLYKSFGHQAVLNGIDLEVAQGETLSVLGRSGTGKSVLLKLVIGLQEPDSGSIRIHGQEITGIALDQLNEIRKKIGFLFQSSALYDSLILPLWAKLRGVAVATVASHKLTQQQEAGE